MAVPARLARRIPSGPRQREVGADSSTWSRRAPGCWLHPISPAPSS